MTTAPRSASQAAHQTRRAMALRDHFLAIGADADTVAALPELGWQLAADTIAAATGRRFKAPSPVTREITVDLLRGNAIIRPVQDTPRPIVVDGRLITRGPSHGRPRVATNISLMCD